MAKKKARPVFQSWEEVNQAMGDLIEIDQHVFQIEATMNNHINVLKKEAELKANPLLARKAELEANIQAFTEHHIDEFKDSKTKSLTFGEVGFRRTTSIVTRNVKAIIEALKQNRMLDCIKTAESIDKDKLGQYDDEALLKVGAKRKAEDRFFCKPNIERIEA